MTPPTCANRNCFDAAMLWQRTDFAGGRITDVYRCSRCKRKYEVVATTLVMLPDTDTERITPLKDEATNG